MGKMGFIREENTTISTEENSLIVPKNFSHSYACGQTSCGKTSSYIYPNLDDRIKSNHGIVVYDYKGKEHRSVKYFAHKYNRLDDVIEIGVPWGASCNLIQYFNSKEIKLFVESIMGLDKEDAYWSTSGKNIFHSLWISIKAYIDVLDEAVASKDKHLYHNVIRRYDLPMELTFYEVAKICKSIKSIAGFLVKVEKVSESFEKITKRKIEDLADKFDNDRIKDKFVNLMRSVLFFKNIVENELNSLHIYRDALRESDQSKTFQTLVLAMSTTFTSIADNKNFNDYNGIDIVQALNDGKIIVINSQEIPNEVLSTLTGSVLQELCKRVRKTDIKPVSFFIDEAFRVLNKNKEVDLHADILRESMVEIFLAFQNYSLMNNAMGSSKFAALAQNLSTSFHFKNPIDYEELQTSKLDTFEYYKDSKQKVLKAEPIFLDADKIFDVELEYFRINDVYEKLNIKEQDRDKVIEFNPYLFQQGKIDLKSKDNTIKTIRLRDKAVEDNVLNSIETIIENHKRFLKRSQATSSDDGLPDMYKNPYPELEELFSGKE